ncbi:hypothetical protein [Fructilactobacillus fructivorans]|uniref:Prolyl-tRNA synthetase n=1 Tax=Fructilactobacillus fructivorans TaxID=1614 RepID=A0A0C1Q3L4_9LACO|nr:hypothetical protein [Fructilactobacillus fructivorans]KID42473.1 Prolyl-tRNA synthetase [Fructilactobacillus fructivorans]
MHYELTNKINDQNLIWKHQRDRIKKSHGKVITLSPASNFRDALLANDISGLNVVDYVTGRTLDMDPKSFLFFNRVPTVDGAEIFMNADFTINIISNGSTIGHVILWPNTRRHVKEVDYVFPNDELDYIEEFVSDGKKFSNIIYTRGQPQRIDFYNDAGVPVLCFYFYKKQLNWVTIEDFDSLKTKRQFNNLDEFYADTVGKYLTPKDSVGISYMGVELWALSQSKSHNTLYLEESPFNADGKVKQNLLDILTDRISYIQDVHMSKEFLQELENKGIPTKKVVVD